MILSNIKQFLEKNKKIFYYLGFFLVVFALSSDVTFAATDDRAKTVTEVGSAILGVLGLLLGFATYLATLFLSPEWINGTLFGLDSKFKDVWILVSNVVYFVFAFILIWIAFMNIIGKTGEQYQLKQALPKFIVGVLIVPFSWFLVQFILSISSILTVAALSLPAETFSSYGVKMEKVIPPNFCTINLNKFSKSTKAKAEAGSEAETNTDSPKDDNDGWISCKNTDKTKEGNTAIDSIFKIIGMYTYGVLSFDSMDELIKDFKGGEVKTLGNLAVQIVFDILFVVIYAILIITLTIVLLIRGIYIWIYTMISPIFGLMYFFDKKEGGEGFFGKFNLKEFIALAMVPVYTMLALSFGLLFIYVIGEGLISNGNTAKEVTINDKTLKIGGFKLEIVGQIGSAQGKDVTGFFKAMAGEGGNALGVVGTLILKVFGIVVLWGAVMAAMRTSEITKIITQPIHDFGTKVGGIVASAPGNIPVFGGKSANELSSAAGAVQSSISGKVSQKGADWGRSFVDGNKKVYNIEDRFRGLTVNQPKEIAKAITDTLSTIEWSDKSQVTAFTKQLSNVGYKADDLDEATFTGANETKIANMLFKAQDSKMTSHFTSYESYRKAMETNLSSKKGVGDNEEIDRGTEYYKNSKGKEFSQNIKVEKDENLTGIGRIIIKQKSGIITEHRIKLQSGGKDTTFEKLNSSDKKEIVDFLGKLDGDQKEEINDILKALGLEKLSSSNKNLKDEIVKYSETLK